LVFGQPQGFATKQRRHFSGVSSSEKKVKKTYECPLKKGAIVKIQAVKHKNETQAPIFRGLLLMVQKSGKKTTWDGAKNLINNGKNYLHLNW